MLLAMFIGAAALCVLLIGLAIKKENGRALFAALAVVALVPMVMLAMMTVNSSNDPAASVTGMTNALAAGEYEAANEFVDGTLGMGVEAGFDRSMANLVLGTLYADCGEVQVDDFAAVVPVELTVLNTEAWLTALNDATVAELSNIVKAKPVEQLFNAAGDAYLDGIADEAYSAALENMLTKGGEYLHTVSVNVNLKLSPFGWKVQLNEALVSALQGMDAGDEGVLVENAELAGALFGKLDTAYADITANLPLLHKAYEIPEDATVAPKPKGKFGSTFDMAEVQAVIEEAALLLDGQELAWNPDLNFWSEEPIRYYYDETILALTWKEIINGNMVTFGEVKFAHPSQLRRAVTGNRYDYGIDEYPTKLAQNVNAVLASAGDFYGFRDLGITVYQRKLYRHNPASVDTAYFTADGNMIFSKRGELMNRADAEQFIKDNDVLFAVAFGPVMVENGVPVHTSEYAIGEVNDRYSRAAIAQKDELHYMVMTVNFDGPCRKTCTLEQAVEYIAAKNVQQAYTLDGGQTASVVLGGHLVNRPDWGEERTMSDIIYFASAVPEE
ncbi:MAG: phosphodiester glycosidase family protein [Oscillospiraceae bacterium]|nr:phosphodiester glycosidase family protein [Oscillospiraceae bacterium]